MIDWEQIQTLVQAGDFVAIAQKHSELRATIASLGDLVASVALTEAESYDLCLKIRLLRNDEKRLEKSMAEAARAAGE